MSGPPPIGSVVPHRGRMLWLDRILCCDSEAIVCAADVRPDAPFVAGTDGAASIVALELMAQAVAAHTGLNAPRRGGRVRMGYVVSVQALELRVDRIAVGQTLRVEARRLGGDDRFGAFDCVVGVDDRRLASGTLAVVQGAADGRP